MSSYDYFMEREYEKHSDELTQQMQDEDEEGERLADVLNKIHECQCLDEDEMYLLTRNLRLE